MSICSAASVLTRWAEPMPEMGRAVYRITHGPKEHKHAYHIYCPWSADGSRLALVRYDRPKQEGEFGLLDTATGDIRPLGRTPNWSDHACARQHWLGDRNRLFYVSDTASGAGFTTVNADGSDERVFSSPGFEPMTCSSDGRWVYGSTPLSEMFPNDDIAPRHDKGLLRMNLETGACELVLSIEQALPLLPNADAVGAYHLWAKMVIVHRRLPRVLFNFTNTFWDRDGKEPRIRGLVTVGTDGSAPAYLGRCLHHPNWHPIEDRVLSNVRDFNDEVRFGLYRGDGSGLLEYVPASNGSGHPSFSPDGRWLCTDGAGTGTRSRIVLCDPTTGALTVAADYEAFSEGYAAFKAIDERATDETVVAALQRAKKVIGRRIRQTQAHPAWSRDGSAVLFNVDQGEGSQLYMLDVNRLHADA